MPNVFLSHSSHDELFVVAVAQHLRRSVDEVFCFEEQQRAGNLIIRMQEALAKSSHFVLFVGTGTASSAWQADEAAQALSRRLHLAVVLLPDVSTCKPTPIPNGLTFYSDQPRLCPLGVANVDARDLAIELCETFDLRWCGRDGLPAEPNLFNYEKPIIDVYQQLAGARKHPKVQEWIRQGMPPEWPTVPLADLHVSPQKNKLIPHIGSARKYDAYVGVSTLRREGAEPVFLGLPEAGPREQVRMAPVDDGQRFKIAVLVVGGIAPGINAVIDGIVSRHWQYADSGGFSNQLEVHGLCNGLHAFDDLAGGHLQLVDTRQRQPGRERHADTPTHAHEGGSILGTSREDELIRGNDRDERLESIARQLVSYQALYVIGGDGGMRLAHALRTFSLEISILAERRRLGTGELRVVGVPKTMDNDILWVWQAFGFLSAVEKAREVVEHMHTEIASNPRLGIVQLFGSVSGFVVSHAVLAGSAPMCDLALVPEVPFALKDVADYLRKRMRDRGPVPMGLVVMAESALPTDAEEVVTSIEADELERAVRENRSAQRLLTFAEQTEVRAFAALRRNGRTLSGQTSDALRSACLKIVAAGLSHLLKDKAPKDSRWKYLRVVTSEPRHLIRAIPPSCQDIITGRRLGTLAVDNAMGGFTDFMISQWLTEFVLVPLPLVVLGRKQIHRDGIFWRSVLTKTHSFEVFHDDATNEDMVGPRQSSQWQEERSKDAQ